MADMEQQAEYLQAHGLDKVLEALVVETMQHQPEDPFDYMSQQMFKMAESFSQLTAHAAASAGGAAPAAKEDGWWTKWKGPDVALSLEEKVKRSAGVAEEIIKDVDELRQVFKRKAHPVCYDGFEPSGRMHIAQGLQRAMNVNRLTESGVNPEALAAVVKELRRESAALESASTAGPTTTTGSRVELEAAAFAPPRG